MASEKRLADDLLGISQELKEAAPRASFFPLVKFLERLTAGAQPLIPSLTDRGLDDLIVQPSPDYPSSETSRSATWFPMYDG